MKQDLDGNETENEHNENMLLRMKSKTREGGYANLKLNKLPARAANVWVWGESVLLGRVVRNLTTSVKICMQCINTTTSFYVVWDDDTFAVVDKLFVVGSRCVSTLVSGCISGIGDLVGGGNIQCGKIAIICEKGNHWWEFSPHHRFRHQWDFWQLPQYHPGSPHLFKKDSTRFVKKKIMDNKFQWEYTIQ